MPQTFTPTVRGYSGTKHHSPTDHQY